MLDNPSPDMIYSSPKRKRSDHSTSMQPSPSRLKISNLPVRPLAEDGLMGQRSLQTALVARHFQNLELKEQTLVPKSSIQTGLEGPMITYHEHHMSTDTNDPIYTSANERPNTPNTNESLPNAELQDVTIPDSPIEIPETPRLKPSISPSPLPFRPKSPPLPSSALWWKDSEITGHDPKDPMDDGYGINGVGFLPTPAIANARAERRKRQVAEWRNREAKEARQKRSDRRRRREIVSGGSGSIKAGLVGREVRKVRFLEA